jgi:hypothetical protein
MTTAPTPKNTKRNVNPNPQDGLGLRFFFLTCDFLLYLNDHETELLEHPGDV